MLRQLNDETHGGNRGLQDGRNGGGVLSISARQSTTAGRGRQILQTADGKVAGVIVNGVLTKTIDAGKHMLRDPRALALDAGAVETAKSQGVTQIVVTDRETDSTYRASLADLLNHGWLLNRGYGWQLALRLDRWQRDGQAVQPEPRPMPDQPQQLALFGGAG